MRQTYEIKEKLRQIVNARKEYYQLEKELEELMGLPEMMLSDVRLDVFVDSEYSDCEELHDDDAQNIIDFIVDNTDIDE